LQTFNINALLSKQLYDAAEYFLGRTLTSDEKMYGLEAQANDETVKKRLAETETAANSSAVLAQLVELIQETKKISIPHLVAAAEPKKDGRKDDDEDIVVGVSDEMEQKENFENWTPELRERVAEMNLMTPTMFKKFQTFKRSQWTKKMEKQFQTALKNELSGEDSIALDTNMLAKYSKLFGREALEKIYNPDLENDPSVYNDELALRLAKLNEDEDPLTATEKRIMLPKYIEGILYSTIAGMAMIQDLRDSNPQMKKDRSSQTLLFSKLPKRNKFDVTEFLHKVKAEVRQYQTAHPEEYQAESRSNRARNESTYATPVKKKSSLMATPLIMKPKISKEVLLSGTGLTNNKSDSLLSSPETLLDHSIKKHLGSQTFVPFGPKWMIAPDRLREQNELVLVRASDRCKISKHPNKVLPATLKVCLTEFLAGRPMPTDILSADDKEWLNWLMTDAKITYKQKPVSELAIKRSPKQIKDRLSVLYGEISEGPNDNPDLRREFVNLFNQGNLRGIFPDKQIFNLQQFISTF